MARKYIDCRDFPDETNCSIALTADSEEELIEAAIEHGTKIHGYENTPETRENVKKGIKEGTPPA
ncbi:MAG: DUF1059 domain-containing protein [Deltaproteobacteria bacterium]|nr:DUF1059 domain-containing protein [Deltaproteobacteria bacterium]